MAEEVKIMNGSIKCFKVFKVVGLKNANLLNKF